MSVTGGPQALQVLIAKLIALAIAMFIFAIWIMPPLYDLFCEVTGINGKTSTEYQGLSYEAVSAEVDTSRIVSVQFVGTKNENMPWAFKPVDFKVSAHPGEAVETVFYAKNPTDKIMVGQAIPSLVPHNATDYFFKTECFCFNQQVLGPGEEAELALQFIVDQEMPKNVKTITLSYTLFDVTENSENLVKQKAKEIAEKENLNNTAPELVVR